MGVLGVEHPDDGFVDLRIGGGGAGGGVLPEEVAQLLGGVWMSMGCVEDGVHGCRSDLLARALELPLDVIGEGRGSITSSSISLALRQNGSFSSLKMRSIMWRLLPR